MKFGKEFRVHLEKTLPEWRDKFLSYKLLKKLLKRYPAVNLPPAPASAPILPLPALQAWFVAILHEELEKFNDFYVEKEEEFIIRFQALKERIEQVKERASDNAVLSSEFSEETMEIRKDFVSIHGEMVLLKSYSSLNFAGLIKILKKYDKRTGELLSLPFTQLAFYQPFFTTQPLTRLVRECEDNLEIIFPLEAEVVESNEEQTFVVPATDAPNASLETVEIYKSTVAAISAIQGLKRASKSYNPMSMSYLFGSHGSESTGDLTAENSPCNSLVSMEDGDGDICSDE